MCPPEISGKEPFAEFGNTADFSRLRFCNAQVIPLPKELSLEYGAFLSVLLTQPCRAERDFLPMSASTLSVLP